MPKPAVLLLSLLLSGCPGESFCRDDSRRPPTRATGAPMVVVAESACRVSPVADSAVQTTLATGAEVRTIWAAEGLYYVEANGGMPCWVDASTVAPKQATGSRGLPLLLAPILVEAGTYLVKGAARWLQGGASNPACGVVQVLREEGRRALIRTADGATGWVARTAVAALAEVSPPATTGTVADMLEGGAIPDPAAGGLTVELRVVRPNGAPVAPDDVLHLHDTYDLLVRCSRDCYTRITAEQPESDAVCQYHPNHFEGFGTSARLAAGRWAQAELLPGGRHFSVEEPIGDADILRVEANTSAPYHYVSGGDRGEGCQATNPFHDGALTGCSRGGGFSGPPCNEAASRSSAQPQASAVAEVRLRTAR
jgi:hypothetical protein